ncbi:glutathione S-transferase family protein [Paucibacter soli]|uniref:glutathione S-transferase family protein n=1 Tax=Paucibacter soli TaxID=3133433 RepID=UPI003095DA21
MTMKILGKASSINVRKVLWTCAELGLDFEREDWGAGFADPQTPEFLKLNPNGMVPVLVDGGFVLWESNSICRYLAAREARGDLLPAAPQPRARVEQWMDWQAGELNNSWRYAFMGLVRQSPAHQDAVALAAGVAGWNRHMAMLDAQLAAGGPYVLGADFTLADVVLGLSVHRWVVAPLVHAELPAVRAYYQLLSARPGFMAHGRNGQP